MLEISERALRTEKRRTRISASKMRQRTEREREDKKERMEFRISSLEWPDLQFSSRVTLL